MVAIIAVLLVGGVFVLGGSIQRVFDHGGDCVVSPSDCEGGSGSNGGGGNGGGGNGGTPTSTRPASTTTSSPVAAPLTPAAPASGSDVGAQQVDLGRVGVDDSAGASPGEVISDSTETPHPVTTPDSPAETVDVAEVKDPDKS